MKNNPQISLREAIDSMKKVVDDVDYQHTINSMTEIIGPDYIPDIVSDCKVVDIDNIIALHYEDVRDYESNNRYCPDGNDT